jgi:hypothetical protein
MQFRAPPPPQVSGARPAQQPCPSDRDYPLDTAGDRCLWHGGGTPGEHEPGSVVPASAQLRTERGHFRVMTWLADGRQACGSRQAGI